MILFRRMKAAVYRWRIARIDRKLDALQARRRGQTDHAALRHLGLAFDALAIDRAIIARRLGRLADGTRAQDVPRGEDGVQDQAALVKRYLQIDEQLGAARANHLDDAALDRLTQELAAAQREIEAGRARRVR